MATQRCSVVSRMTAPRSIAFRGSWVDVPVESISGHGAAAMIARPADGASVVDGPGARRDAVGGRCDGCGAGRVAVGRGDSPLAVTRLSGAVRWYHHAPAATIATAAAMRYPRISLHRRFN